MNANQVSTTTPGSAPAPRSRNVTQQRLKRFANKFAAAFILMTSFSISSHATFGGFSGNVIAPTMVQNPQNPILVSRVIEHARQVLPSYLVQKENELKRGRLSASDTTALGPLLRRKTLIVMAMKRVRIAIETQDACYDRKHVPFDGSTLGSQPNSICMSALSLSRRVEADMMPVEATALLLHEYSEVIGLSDQQAILAQTVIYRDLLLNGNTPR